MKYKIVAGSGYFSLFRFSQMTQIDTQIIADGTLLSARICGSFLRNLRETKL
jgi:hypothetical protein